MALSWNLRIGLRTGDDASRILGAERERIWRNRSDASSTAAIRRQRTRLVMATASSHSVPPPAPTLVEHIVHAQGIEEHSFHVELT